MRVNVASFLSAFLVLSALGWGTVSAASMACDPYYCLILTPAEDTNPVGTSHTVTGTVTTLSGVPAEGVYVEVNILSQGERGFFCGPTDAQGECSITYVGPSTPFADVITGCLIAGDGTGTRTCAEALKAWVPATSTPGQATGGGYILDPGDDERVVFGFSAKNMDQRMVGSCSLVDAAPARAVKIKCLSVTAFAQTVTHVTFSGQAEVNGVTTDYRIDVDDHAEPGRGVDTFRITTGTGYSAAGVLDGGNIQVHPAK